MPSMLAWSLRWRARVPKVKILAKNPQLHITTNGIDFLSAQQLKKDSTLAGLLSLLPNSSCRHMPFIVHVLLDESANGKTSWHLCAVGGFVLVDDKKQMISYPNQDLYVTYKQDAILINGKRWRAKTCYVLPRQNYIRFRDNVYAGTFFVQAGTNSCYLINQVELEDYVGSVLQSESWPGWPLEVNKAFAIASRSYAVFKILEARKQNKMYHIKNSNIHQTYKGIYQNNKLAHAIEQTRGLILTHNKKPIEAMFDVCCGDVIPAHMQNINFEKAPYLARSKKCTYCKKCKVYSWKAEYPLHAIETTLRGAGIQVTTIKDLKVAKKDKAGVVQEIAVRAKSGLKSISGKKMYSLFTKLKSFCYNIEKKGASIIFTGKGYGHHLGICQWGARRMIDAGINFASILKFYYPGTQLMELKLTNERSHAKL
jgi:stage II sporulation protein D